LVSHASAPSIAPERELKPGVDLDLLAILRGVWQGFEGRKQREAASPYCEI
jgi:hypothetical protein